MRKEQAVNKTRTITLAAFVLSLCIICIMLFRGSMSIMSSLLIPPLIAVFSLNQKKIYWLYVTLGLILTVSVLFNTQIIFVSGYILLALALRYLMAGRDSNINTGFFNSAAYIILSMAVIILGIMLTEKVFLIPLHSMMLRISGGKLVVYTGIIFVESALIFISNIMIFKLLFSKLKKFMMGVER